MTPPEPRILMTTDTVGGVWTYSITLARALCARGYALTLVTLGPPPADAQRAAAAQIGGLQLIVTDLALEWMDPHGRDRERARDLLLRLADEVKPDIVHLNSFREAIIDFAAPVLVVAHSCVGSWWQACRPQQPMERRWQPYLRNVAAGLDAAAAWVAPTRTYRDWIEAFYAPQSTGQVIWNSSATAAGAAAKQPTVLAAGRLWDEAKNLRAVAAAASRIPWPVHIAGRTSPDGPDAPPDGVTALGALPHQAALAAMQRAAVYASPALYEPFGLAILEAAGRGCALVLGDIPTLRELWWDAALFVPPQDSDALAYSLRRLCKDATLRQRLGRAARARARRYTVETMLDGYAALYRRLHDPKQQPTRRPFVPMEMRG